MTQLEIDICIVLAIYFAANLLILWLVHIFTRKYDDKE